VPLGLMLLLLIVWHSRLGCVFLGLLLIFLSTNH